MRSSVSTRAYQGSYKITIQLMQRLEYSTTCIIFLQENNFSCCAVKQRMLLIELNQLISRKSLFYSL